MNQFWIQWTNFGFYEIFLKNLWTNLEFDKHFCNSVNKFLILMNIFKSSEQKLSGWTFFELLNIFPIDEFFWIRWTKSIRKFKNKIRKKSK